MTRQERKSSQEQQKAKEAKSSTPPPLETTKLPHLRGASQPPQQAPGGPKKSRFPKEALPFLPPLARRQQTPFQWDRRILMSPDASSPSHNSEQDSVSPRVHRPFSEMMTHSKSLRLHPLQSDKSDEFPESPRKKRDNKKKKEKQRSSMMFSPPSPANHKHVEPSSPAHSDHNGSSLPKKNRY